MNQVNFTCDLKAGKGRSLTLPTHYAIIHEKHAKEIKIRSRHEPRGVMAGIFLENCIWTMKEK
jgi:hypothetical protein